MRPKDFVFLQEVIELKQFTAGPNETGVRLSRFVQKVTSNLPSSLLHKSFRNRRIKVNGKRAAEDYRLCEGDLIELYLNDEFFPAPQPEKKYPRSGHRRLKVVYEDDNIALLYKPVHILCHSDRTQDANLVDWFVDYLIEKGEYKPAGGSPFRPALCNRLDRGTEGIVLAAKTYTALRDATALVREDLLTKKYLCIVKGCPPEGVHTAYLFKDEAKNRVRIFRRPSEGRKEIVTGVHLLESKAGLSLCEITLFTGRTHQIRAHLAFLGSPLLGDRKYGDEALNALYPRQQDQLLCAVSLGFSKEISPENSLAYLAGKQFTLTESSVAHFWNEIIR